MHGAHSLWIGAARSVIAAATETWESEMKAAVVTFPGSNCDRDLAVAFEKAGFDVTRIWHKDTSLPQGTDVVGIPGGFSFGDYLRCGAIAAQSPIAKAIASHAGRGGYVMGVCNGFQVLTEMRLLPGALMRNAGLKFLCKTVTLRVATTASAFTSAYAPGEEIAVPIAHHDGNYTIDAEGLARLQGEDRVAFTYAQNPNGSMADIAGILSENRRVLGLMPHPERVVEDALGGSDGMGVFAALMGGMALA
jgi:phosphoribosylformylglycinamidine synthase subunit PurQ / glutaminase